MARGLRCVTSLAASRADKTPDYSPNLCALCNSDISWKGCSACGRYALRLSDCSLGFKLSGGAGIMAGFSSALLTRKAFLGGSAKVGRDTNGAKTFALFKKAEKKVKQATAPAKKNVKQAQKKVLASYSIPNQQIMLQDSGPVCLLAWLLSTLCINRCRHTSVYCFDWHGTTWVDVQVWLSLHCRPSQAHSR